MQDILTIKDASLWASRYIGKDVTPSNISYLVQYGKIPKISHNNGARINKVDLQDYYDNLTGQQSEWQQQLGEDLNWRLSFSEYKESETTKHVHRLHPYKGKFIPQLVEYFLDSHTDEFKQRAFFSAGDIVLDPFCGSGTVLVQANELSMHAIGIDVSAFNSFMGNVKVLPCDTGSLSSIASVITERLQERLVLSCVSDLDERVGEALKDFNMRYFPSPEYRSLVRGGEIDEKVYGIEKAESFGRIYDDLVGEYNISMVQDRGDSFLDCWFLSPVREEIDFIFGCIQELCGGDDRRVLALILSRTMRSCRATTHADLGTLREPMIRPYYCKKHGKVCRPLLTSLYWWRRYCQDTLSRFHNFSELRTSTHQICLTGDSRNLDILGALQKKQPEFAEHLRNNKLAGIFSSPPYVGLIDYHEQHAYAYDLFGFVRRDELEIGPLSRGQSVKARQDYVQGIAQTLINSKAYLRSDYNIFLVANDKYSLYPRIADIADMRIVNEYKRPVLNRVEKGRSAYSEKIFHLQRR